MKNWLNHRLSKDCFIRFNKKQYSFQNIGDTVYDRALSLIDFGIKKGDKIALFLPEALDFIEVYFLERLQGMHWVCIGYALGDFAHWFKKGIVFIRV